MPTISVTAARDRYLQQAGSAGTRFVEGAQRFQGDPTALAAAQGQKAQANYNEAWASGRVQRGLQAAGRSGWLAGVTSKGAQNYANGIQNGGADKWASAMNRWFPIFDQIEAHIDTMPNNTTQDAIARVAYWINATKAAKAQS